MNPPPPRQATPLIQSLFLQPLIVCLAGVAIGILLSSSIHFSLPILLILDAILVLPLIWTHTKPTLYLFLLLATAALFGAARTRASLTPPASDDVSKSDSSKSVILEGQIDEVPDLTRNGTRFVLRATRRILGPAEWQPLTGRILIYLPEKIPDLAFGDRLRARVKVSPPRNYRTPGAFDYVRHLERRNIHVVGYVHDSRHLAVLGDRPSTGFRGWILRVRNRLDDALSRHFPPRSAGLAKAFLIGRRDALSEQDEDIFRRAGVVHILSVSGLHMGVVGLSVFAVLWRLLAAIPGLALRMSVRKMAAVFAIGPTVLYLFLSGAEPPAVRSTLLIGLFCMAQLVERPKEPFHALAVSALIMLVARPLLLFDISFQLTFLSVLGILMAMHGFPVLEFDAEGITRILFKPIRGLIQGLTATIGATLLTAPLVLQAFNLFSPVAILSNLVIAPLSSVAVVLLLLLTPAALSGSSILPVLITPVQALLNGITDCAKLLSNLPAASLWLPEPTLTETCLLVTLGTSLLLIRRRVGRAGLALSVLGLGAVMGGGFLHEHRAGTFKAVFLDVGQGDSAWVRLPSGKTMLIDAGGGAFQTFDVGKNVVARYLWLRKQLRVDVLAISHPHPDHADGAKFILEHFRVGELWTSPEFPGPDGYGAELLDIAKHKGIPHRVLQAGDVAWQGPSEIIRALAPPTALYDDVNDNSLVLRIDADGANALFPGDIGTRSETRMWLAGEDLHAALLKVPHHGSRTSSSEAFLQAVLPKHAVVSVGADNRYGLPDEEILERIAKVGAEVVRLDQTGAVAFEWKNGKWQRATP
ncbi:MAG: DNA internalization-related competence protein ComEC/Rec2 [Nitrospirae bacterium]|nr:DNA internalization-related competence protein ComEC/Rec2 [Nitrospirota bacterium]